MMRMVFTLILLSLISFTLIAAEIKCDGEINTVVALDDCLKKNNRKPTKNTQEILEWKRKLKITAPLTIEVEKIQTIVAETCSGNENPKVFATKVSKEVEKILQAGSLQLSDWRIPNFGPTGAMDYSMKRSRNCDVKDLLQQMKTDVEGTIPDLMNVYNFGLALDTTGSQERNMQILAQNIDSIYESVPADANISFVVTAYGDDYRGGLKFEGDKSYVIPRVKNFILSQRVHGGGSPPEFVYGGSYITSKNLGRAHGLIFNWTNATGDNTTAQTRNGKIAYTLKHLSGFAKQNVHVIRNVFVVCK